MLHMNHVENRIIDVRNLLKPLTHDEQNNFFRYLKTMKSDLNHRDNQAFCIWLIDRLHDEHIGELATATSIIVNKLVNKPFLGDRTFLKSTLENIMQGCYLVENEIKNRDNHEK